MSEALLALLRLVGELLAEPALQEGGEARLGEGIAEVHAVRLGGGRGRGLGAGEGEGWVRGREHPTSW